jgi:sugar/nucleoside kinase (ribokinase family)
LTPSLTVVGLVYFEVAVPIDAVVMGKETFVDRIASSAGGALNTAWIAHALGMPVVLAHPSGGGVTDRAASMLIWSLGITSLTWDARDDVAISLVLTSEDDRAFVSAADFSALESCPDLVRSSWIHVPGLREARVLNERLASARARGSKISVAASWAVEELDSLAGSRQPWDLLFLNELEAERAAGSVEDAPARLASVAPNVIVTRGARGAIGIVGGERFSVPARAVQVRSATGAGDAFAAGFLAAHANGASPCRSAEIGTDVAARRIAATAAARFDRAIFSDLKVAR